MKIEIDLKPTEKDAQLLSKGIDDFNHAVIPNLESIQEEVKFFVFVRDEKQKIVGGIRAICFWNTLHIELFWLSEACRGKGAGRDLITKAEQFAVENGCDKAFVETTSWQAKPFYEKMGYQLMATLQGRPKGYASHYLTKEIG